jgi:arylsulfatase A-like enzyme
MVFQGCSKSELSIINTEYDFLLALDQAQIQAQNPAFVTPKDARLTYPSGEVVSHWGIFQHAPSSIVFDDVFVGKDAYIETSVAIRNKAWDKEGDGVKFEISAIKDGVNHVCWSKYIDPKNNPNDRKWHDIHVAIDGISDATVSFIFKAYPGENKDLTNNSFDWGLWGSPKLISKGREINHIAKNQTNVILITIDTLRYDYLGCYGNDWIDTKAIDKIAEKGVVFENAYAASSTTSPSHVSILTSMQPYQHGVISNNIKLAGKVPQLPEILKEKGYKTGASISVMHLIDQISGLGKWFDKYNHLDMKWMALGMGYENVTRGAYTTTNAAIKWLEEDSHNDPFFLWVHYYDPHMPYYAEAGYHKKFYDGDPKDPAHKNMNGVQYHKGVEQAYDWAQPYTDLEFFKKEYGAEISFVDNQIERLLNTLDNLHVTENTMIVITADHGENLGDHKIYFDHWTLYDSDIHVPLIISYPAKIPQGIRVDTPVTHIDIAPTILDVVGEKDNYLADKMFEGKSLKPLWQKNASMKPRIISSDGLLYTGIAAMNENYKVIWELRDAIYHNDLKLYMDRVWIFDRKNDPENNNPIGCFYWGDDVGRIEFKQRSRQEILSIKGESDSDKSDKQLTKKLELTRQWVSQKEIPTNSQLENWLQEDQTKGTFLNKKYINDSGFIEELILILKTLKSRVNPMPLDEKLSQIIDIAIFDDSELKSIPITDSTINEMLNSLGYAQND